jgi:hypothetical protein
VGFTMKGEKIIIERSKDAFWAYAEQAEGVSGAGDTVEEAKQSLLESIELQKELGNWPKSLGESYTLVYKFDAESLLHYFKGVFTHAAFERITGINQKQLQHYASGLRKPRPQQAKKIEAALHKLGHELLSMEL